jgi:hypothetical protein
MDEIIIVSTHWRSLLGVRMWEGWGEALAWYGAWYCVAAIPGDSCCTAAYVRHILIVVHATLAAACA